MDDYMFVHVPSDLWELLKAADFDEVETNTRSADQWSSVIQAVLSVGQEGLDVSADLVGVYLAREQIADFARRTAAWFGFRVPAPRSGEGTTGPGAAPLVFTITTGPPGSEVRIEIRSTPGPDGAPVLDATALVNTLVAAIETPSPAAPRSTGSPAAG
ncbi:hypothetical protein [Kitasatospora sp. NPDC002965]|uniref:hypothetical protein n=1 Tax=Kitasatospora sp. NPDC002965 TaxID=3154775 RepID=UPI0033B50F4B